MRFFQCISFIIVSSQFLISCKFWSVVCKSTVWLAWPFLLLNDFCCVAETSHFSCRQINMVPCIAFVEYYFDSVDNRQYCCVLPESLKLSTFICHIAKQKTCLLLFVTLPNRDSNLTVSNMSLLQPDMQSKKRAKLAAKRIRKMQEEEKRLQEKEFEMAFFREFWPDNV